MHTLAFIFTIGIREVAYVILDGSTFLRLTCAGGVRQIKEDASLQVTDWYQITLCAYVSQWCALH